MKAPVLLCLAFSLASALAKNEPAKNSDKSDDAKASAAFLAGDYDSAISLYTEVIKADPKAALAYNGRALAYFYKKETTKRWPISIKPSGSSLSSCSIIIETSLIMRTVMTNPPLQTSRGR